MTFGGIRFRSLAAAVATSMVAGVVAVVFAAPAQARCHGHTEVRSNLVVGAYGEAAAEVPASGTCNSNNTYAGYFQSNWSGWDAIVYIQNNGDWQSWRCSYGTICSYKYADDNFYSYIHFCVVRVGTIDYICGWGTRFEQTYTHYIYGENWGF